MNPANVTPVALEEALTADPTYRHLKSKLDLLVGCPTPGTISWIKVAPVSLRIREEVR
jgi:hypothetical protein